MSSSGDRRLSRRSIGRVESVIRVDGESKLRPVLELFDKKSLDLGRPSVPLVAVDRIDGQIIGQVRSQLTVIVGIESRDPIRKEFFEFRQGLACDLAEWAPIEEIRHVRKRRTSMGSPNRLNNSFNRERERRANDPIQWRAARPKLVN